MAWGLKRLKADRWTTLATGPAFVLYTKIVNPSEDYPAAVRLVVSGGYTPPPEGVAVAVTGSGTTIYRYGVSAVTESGETEPTMSAGVGNGEILDAGHYNRITWDPVAGAIGYRVYRYMEDRIRSVSLEGDVTAYDDVGNMTDLALPKLLNETVVKGAELFTGYISPSAFVDTEKQERFFLDEGESLLIWSDREDVSVTAFGMIRKSKE